MEGKRKSELAPPGGDDDLMHYQMHVLLATTRNILVYY